MVTAFISTMGDGSYALWLRGEIVNMPMLIKKFKNEANTKFMKIMGDAIADEINRHIESMAEYL